MVFAARRYAWAGIAALSLLMFGMSKASWANGRYPLAQQLFEDPEQPERIWLRATFGILSNRAGAERWSWVCENAVGYGGTEDPFLGLMRDGAMLAGFTVGVALSRDRGCNWAFVPEFDGAFIADLSVDKADPERAVVLVSTVQVGGTFINQVFETTDNALSWSELGVQLDSGLIPLTLDPAASDPQTLYVSGLDATNVGVLLSSTDRGETWQSFSVPDTSGLELPYIAAVHPDDARSVFVRVDGINSDRLLHTLDFGRTWTELLSHPAKLFGFALSPDGTELLAGFGENPEVSNSSAEGFGIWRSAVDSPSFRQVFAGPIYCLTWTESGLYACTSRLLQGYDLGFVEQVDFELGDGDPFVPRMTLPAICGADSCPQGTSGDRACPEVWQETCAFLGTCDLDGQPTVAAADVCGDGMLGGPTPSAADAGDPAASDDAGSSGGDGFNASDAATASQVADSRLDASASQADPAGARSGSASCVVAAPGGAGVGRRAAPSVSKPGAVVLSLALLWLRRRRRVRAGGPIISPALSPAR